MERRKTKSFEEQLAKHSGKRPEPYTAKSSPAEKSSYSHLEVEFAIIKIEYKYKKLHGGSNDFKNFDELKQFLNRNQNILEFLKGKK